MEGIHHLALRVSDCDASARFYSDVLGLPEIRRIERENQRRAVWLRIGSTVLMLEQALRGEGPAGGSGHVLVFPCDDLVRAEERLEQQGIRLTDRTAATLYFQDPDGHRVGLSAHRFAEIPEVIGSRT